MAELLEAESLEVLGLSKKRTHLGRFRHEMRRSVQVQLQPVYTDNVRS